jgi:mono/diheme cytochrome c family protein
MKQVKEMNRKLIKLLFFFIGIIIIYSFTLQEWEIPEKYKKKANPYKGKKLEIGEKIYKKTCSVCHLVNGEGNHVITPIDFTSETFQAQTDGALFYKISEGREGTTMMAYGDAYAEKKLWYLVNYLRTFEKE